MRSNNCENVDNSFIYYKDYNNGIFNFKLYFQDMIIPAQNEKKVIRNLLAYFVEPKMHDFYQFSLGAGPFTMPTELLKVGTVDLQSDQVTMALDKLMIQLLAAPGKQNFYSQFGFKVKKEVAEVRKLLDEIMIDYQKLKKK